MCDRNDFRKALLALPALLLVAGAARAYVGPGADPATLGYFAGLVGWAAVAFSAVLLWPFYALMRHFRRPRNAPPPAEETRAGS